MAGRSILLAALMLAPLGGCGRTADDDPAAIGADDDRQLNQAAEALDGNAIEARSANSIESSPHD